MSAPDLKAILGTLDGRELGSPQIEDPPAYKVIAHLSAGGASKEQIANMTGIALSEVHDIIKLDHIKAVIKDIRKNQAGQDYKQLFRSMVPDAADAVQQVMITGSDANKLAAAKEIMDRGLGRPQQNLEVGGSLLRDVIERLDKIDQGRNGRLIEAEAKQVQNVEEGQILDDAPEDTVDKFLRENFS